MEIILLLISFIFFTSAIVIFLQLKSFLINSKKQSDSSWYKNDDGSFKWLIILSAISTIFGLLSLIWFIYYVTNKKLINNTQNSTELAYWGQFGDFVGGFVSVFFTIVGIFLLYETLSLQRKELKESRDVFQRQRFEDTFFKMISMYQEIVKDMTYVNFDTKVVSGKEYFKGKQLEMQIAFTSLYNIYQSNKNSISAYDQFYMLNKNYIAHYYRTLYRIFKFIDDSDFDSQEKMKYAKTVRALLSESELFFLNYNAQTEYGKNFKTLINRYNLLKHLPILEKLEFKWLAEKLTQEMRLSMSMLLFEIKRDCLLTLKSREKITKNFFQSRIQLSIERRSNEELRILIMIKKTIPSTNSFQKGFGLHVLSENDLRELLFNILHEIIEFQNYNYLNKEAITYEKYLNSNAHRAIIWANAKSHNEIIINDDWI